MLFVIAIDDIHLLTRQEFPDEVHHVLLQQPLRAMLNSFETDIDWLHHKTVAIHAATNAFLSRRVAGGWIRTGRVAREAAECRQALYDGLSTLNDCLTRATALHHFDARNTFCLIYLDFTNSARCERHDHHLLHALHLQFPDALSTARDREGCKEHTTDARGGTAVRQSVYILAAHRLHSDVMPWQHRHEYRTKAPF